MIKLVCEGDPIARKGRPPKIDGAMPMRERVAKHRTRRQQMKRRCVAVLDTETDPFDNELETKVFPFVACLYSDQFDPIIIWDENRKRFVQRLLEAIEALPDEYTIYAHNGGKFDFMFLVSQLRGTISFKGRGIMSAKIGRHELRDSFDVIPERLAAYRKDEFDYSKMTKDKRHKHRAEIIEYLKDDCIFLFELMRDFVDRYGLKLTIGQTAMGLLKEHYNVERFTDNWDATVRNYFFGGRVECIQGRGDFRGPYKLFDVNSMYPFVMANYAHPIGSSFDYKYRRGPIRDDTVFIDVTCDNRGALIARNEEKETVATIKRGRFFTTIWEFDVAIKYGLISNIEINFVLDCPKRTDFSKFILPIYHRRQELKAELKRLEALGQNHTQAYQETKRDDMFHKFLMNSGYGKFAQNPRNFKEHYLSDPDERPPADWFRSLNDMKGKVPPENLVYLQPEYEAPDYWIWTKPNPGFRFNNVGVAASITGAARAVLLEALQHADDPIYCDTDSIICRDLGGVKIHKTELGAWDLEDEFSRVVIAGKKLYGCERKSHTCEKDRFKIRSKGSAAPSWAQLLHVLAGNSVVLRNKAPTLDRFGGQEYLHRTIRATAPILNP